MSSRKKYRAGFAAILFDEQARGWHDRVAGTLVVGKDAGAPGQADAPPSEENPTVFSNAA